MKLNSTMGTKKIRSFCVYDYEYTKLKNLYNMLKKERYETYVDENGNRVYELYTDEKGNKSYRRKKKKQ